MIGGSNMNTLDKSKNTPINILLVEDDDGDAKAVKRTFSKQNIENTIVRVHDGIEALDLLRGRNDKLFLPSPYILLVDLNMPRMNGIQFIRELREDEQLQKTIVFALTTSKSGEDLALAYGLNVAGYIVKEAAGQNFIQLANLIESYWKIVEFP